MNSSNPLDQTNQNESSATEKLKVFGPICSILIEYDFAVTILFAKVKSYRSDRTKMVILPVYFFNHWCSGVLMVFEFLSDNEPAIKLEVLSQDQIFTVEDRLLRSQSMISESDFRMAAQTTHKMSGDDQITSITSGLVIDGKIPKRLKNLLEDIGYNVVTSKITTTIGPL